MDLPVNFKESMKELLGREADELFDSYSDPPQFGLRVNTCKVTCEEFEKIAPFGIEKIPFISNGYYISGTDAWSKHPYYYAGLYYLQEPSAMLPASILPVDKDNMIMDLCAAPGGKSTAMLCNHPRMLVSNDISFSRTMALVKNIEHTGQTDVIVTCADPEKLAPMYSGCFDRILVDAPCSGEGMFRKDPGLISSYRKKGPEAYSGVQASILDSAYEMLTPGGKLLYSTCTYSDIEDEQVIIAFLENHSDMRVCDIPKGNGLCGPYEKYADKSKITGCVHAFLHRFKGEGHFVALLEKDTDAYFKAPATVSGQKNIGFMKLPKTVRDFFEHVRDDFRRKAEDAGYIVSSDGFVYLLPGSFDEIYRKGIRFVRTGLNCGSINKAGKFTPSTALALALKKSEFDNVLDMSASDPDIIRFLKGETIIRDGAEMKKGHVLVCVDSYPLGFASYDMKKMKNLYEKGWTYK